MHDNERSIVDISRVAYWHSDNHSEEVQVISTDSHKLYFHQVECEIKYVT